MAGYMLDINNLSRSRFFFALIALSFFIFNASLFSHNKLNESLFIEEEKGLPYSGAYILPNEYALKFYADVVKDAHGTLISVGAFRSLILFAMGKFEYGVLLDIDRAIRDFNIAHLELIRAVSNLPNTTPSEQRAQYQAALLASQFTPKELSAIEKDPASRALLLASKVERCSSIRFNDVKDKLPIHVKNYLESILKIYKNMGSNKGIEYACNIGRSLYDHVPEKDPIYYWNSDPQWLKLTHAIKANKIAIVNGSVAGEKTLKSTAHVLAQLNQIVSVIDISNVPDYLNKNDVKNFLENINDLPTSNDTILLFTRAGTKGERAKFLGAHGLWDYAYLIKRNFSDIADLSGEIADYY